MRTGATISGGLHVVAVLAAVYGLPWVLRPEPPQEQPILVELVQITDRTTPQLPVPPKPKEKAEVPKPPPPQEVKRHAAAPPPPPAPPEPEPKPTPKTSASAPVPDKVLAPPPPKPEAKPKPLTETRVAAAPEPKPKPKPKAEPEKTPPPKPKPEQTRAQSEARPDFKKAPRPATKPTPPNRRFDAGRLTALLDKSDRKRSVQPDEEAEAKPKDKQPVQQTARERTDQPLTMSEIDAIRFQIQQCWSIPAGARDAEDLVVRIRVFLNPDGSLARPPEIVDVGRNDTFFRTAAESARRAVLKCSPLKNLPVEKYNQWRELTLTFNPRDMLEG